MATEEHKKRLYDLSDRELQVLQLFCERLPYKAIAKRLGIQTGGVKTHMSHIRDKLRVTVSRQITRQYCPLLEDAAIRSILIPIPEPVAEPPEPEASEVVSEAVVPEAQPATPVDTGTVEITAEHDTVEATPEAVDYVPEPPAVIPAVPPVTQPETPNKKGLIGILVGIAIGAIVVCCLITAMVFIFRDRLFGSPATPTAEVPGGQPITVVVTATPAPQPPAPTTAVATPTAVETKSPTVTDTAAPPSATPTATPIPPTPTPSATATPTLPPTPTLTPSLTPVPTPLGVGGRWQENGVALKLLDVFYRADKECVVMRYNLYNNTDHAIIVTIDINNFVITDNLGRTWRANGMQNFNCSYIYNTIYQESRSVNPGDDLGRQTLAFVGHLTDTNTDYIDIVVNMSHINNAKWRIPIDN